MNENHMKNASDSFAKGAKKASDHAAHGRVVDALGSAFEGTTTAAKELAKSASERVANVMEQVQDRSDAD